MGAGASTPHTISISPTGKVIATDVEGLAIVLEGKDRREANVLERAIKLTFNENCSDEIRIQVEELKRLASTFNVKEGGKRLVCIEFFIACLIFHQNILV